MNDDGQRDSAIRVAGADNLARRFRSISEEVAETLRDMILVGQLQPGAQVTQDDLATRLGVSTMPVREALQRLSHEGFVEARRGRSFRVVRTTSKDVADMYWLHTTIERQLTRRACDRADQVVPDLEACTRAWQGAVDSQLVERLEELNFRFHRTINQAADSPALARQLRQTLRSIPQHFYSLLPEWAELSAAGHQEILDALRRRDADGAGEAAARHVLDAGQLLIKYFTDTGVWKAPGATIAARRR
jgi:DNA-binding GntR family transcriptional regulator